VSANGLSNGGRSLDWAAACQDLPVAVTGIFSVAFGSGKTAMNSQVIAVARSGATGFASGYSSN